VAAIFDLKINEALVSVEIDIPWAQGCHQGGNRALDSGEIGCHGFLRVVHNLQPVLDDSNFQIYI
jgi:hypothetical protein